MATMAITVKLFAAYREAVGARELVLDVPEQTTTGELVALLAERYPSLRPLVGSAAVAVDRQYVGPGQPLRAGDEVVLLPPVAGGAGPASGGGAGDRGPFAVIPGPIDAAAVAAQVAYPGAGAVVLFTGIVRALSDSGRAVTHLEYEAYPEMAEEHLATIAAEIRARWGLDRVAIVHRIGRLAVGEVAVAIAVASPHRREGFEACQYAIDRLKQIVPIWKKEIGPDGAVWVE